MRGLLKLFVLNMVSKRWSNISVRSVRSAEQGSFRSVLGVTMGIAG